MTRSSFYAALCAALLVAASVGTAGAKPTRLTNTQLDRVAAGSDLSIGSIFKLPVWKNPLSPPVINPGGPIINPGGPILISCIVGTGCIIRPYP
ncbi:MAG TPA: hypothetical protein VJ770_02940 [Stellaceae bacterium]|nr:hypothetical protein [Stellaceae bacterium]